MTRTRVRRAGGTERGGPTGLAEQRPRRGPVDHAHLAALLDRQRAELERSNAELEQFAYVTSHDLSEPLRVINGFTQLLAEELGDNLDPVVQEYCSFITEATARMRALLTDLLTYSRVGRSGSEAVPVDLDVVLADVGELLAPTVAQAGGELKIANELGTVVAHAPELVQLFQNLVANGLKFHPADGAPVVHVASGDDGDSSGSGSGSGHLTVVVVDDNGIGIEPKYRDQIFQMFRRLHGRTAYPGTGIGLALSRKIAGTLGGTITVGDSPLGGSRFTVSLPTCEEFG